MPPETTRAAAPKKKIRVRATKLGFYDHVRRREGDVFTIHGDEAFSSRWMERVSANTPESVTTGNQALRQHHDETMREKAAGAGVGNDSTTGSADVIGARAGRNGSDEND